MLTDLEISIVALLRGIGFTSAVLNLDRVDVISKVMNTDVSKFFGQVKNDILHLIIKKGYEHVAHLFSIDDKTLKLLDECLDSDSDSHIEDIPGKRKRESNETIQSLVTSSNFFKGLSGSKNKGVVRERITAMSKEFLVQEAEKLSNRYAICEKYDVDRIKLKDWIRSYHKMGVLRRSQRKFNVASGILKEAYKRLMEENSRKKELI